MDGTMSLEQSAIREVSSLFGDEGALRRVISFTKRLKRDSRKAAADSVMTPEDKREILADIKQGLFELKMVKQGKLESHPVNELINEL